MTKFNKPEPRPAFMVNPPIILAINDEMARDVVSVLRQCSLERELPPHVFAFMRQIENDLSAA